jgi:hypothetical protein
MRAHATEDGQAVQYDRYYTHLLDRDSEAYRQWQTAAREALRAQFAWAGRDRLRDAFVVPVDAFVVGEMQAKREGPALPAPAPSSRWGLGLVLLGTAATLALALWPEKRRKRPAAPARRAA